MDEEARPEEVLEVVLRVGGNPRVERDVHLVSRLCKLRAGLKTVNILAEAPHVISIEKCTYQNV